MSPNLSHKFSIDNLKDIPYIIMAILKFFEIQVRGLVCPLPEKLRPAAAGVLSGKIFKNYTPSSIFLFL